MTLQNAPVGSVSLHWGPDWPVRFLIKLTPGRFQGVPWRRPPGTNILNLPRPAQMERARVARRAPD